MRTPSTTRFYKANLEIESLHFFSAMDKNTSASVGPSGLLITSLAFRNQIGYYGNII